MSTDISTAFESGYTFDPETPWGPLDEAALETSLAVAAHFDGEHDPVACQIGNVRSRDPRGGHQPRDEWKLLREDAGLTLAELAEQVGVGAEAISRYESNKRTPENEWDYFSFLQGQAAELAADARAQVYLLQSKRDGWFERTGQHWARDAREAHWETLFKTGGLFDRWTDTGTLPEWTPEDAGHAAA